MVQRNEASLTTAAMDCSTISNSGRKTRTLSLNDMDSTAQDFWNMTLDDLTVADEDDDDDDNDVDKDYDQDARPYRRRSDTMINSSSIQLTATTITTKKKKGMPSRSVTFGSVRVREHDRVLGEHPCADHGPSLSLGWKYHDKYATQGGAIDLSDWEKKKRLQRRRSSWGSQSSSGSGTNSSSTSSDDASATSNSKSIVALSAEMREKIARRSGFSKQEIAENVKENEKIQRRRERTRLQVEKECFQEQQRLLQDSRDAVLQRFLQAQAQKRNKAASTGVNSTSQRGGRSAVLGGATAVRV